MLRAVVIASLVFLSPATAAQPATGVLRITVALVNADGGATPVPRHILLISDNPASAPPRRVLTAPDGTAVVKLPPGNYTVESDRPVAFQGKSYEWRQTLDIAAGRDAVLALTTDNAEVAAAAPATASAPTAPAESDPSFLLTRWQDSVVTLWMPTTRASGFVVDRRGLVVTSQRAIGAATRVEVQLTPAVKVAARVLVADAARDVAVLWIDREVVAAVQPVPLGCEASSRPAVANRQEIFALGAPMRGPKDLTSGMIFRATPESVAADLDVEPGAVGGPVFAAGGSVIGIASILDEANAIKREETPITRIDAACAAVASAETKMPDGPAPDGTRLPVEPMRPFPMDALREVAAGRRAGVANPYQLSSTDFDIAVITPVLTYAAQNPSTPETGRGSIPSQGNAPRKPPPPPQQFVRALMDFGGWSDYVAEFPPVLLIRVTPRLVEGFWTKVGRAAASTQGIALPPIKRITSGFARLRAFCGETEVTPVHPFMIVQRVSASDAVAEGLYVFHPDALAPQCGTVKLELYSEKAPTKADTRVVDAKLLEQIWQDFAPHRAAVP